MKTWLVTGGAGFIGSHLCEALLAGGDAVVVLDDLSSGHRHNLPPAARLVVGDVADPATLAPLVGGIDGCFHLAAIASVARGVTEWVATHRANLTATVTLLDAIRGSGRAVPVVYASSAAVYGDCRTVPIAETAEKAPLSAYGADKYGCELHARVASHVHAIPTTGLRFFNVYGPRQDPKSPYSGVISIFCDRIRAGKGIDIFGDGQQTRDFVFVRDVVAALMAAMAHASTDAPVFNVCTGHPTTVGDLAATIADLAGVAATITHQPPRAGEIRHSLGDPTRARAALGLTAPRPLRDGLAEVLGWLGKSG